MRLPVKGSPRCSASIRRITARSVRVVDHRLALEPGSCPSAQAKESEFQRLSANLGLATNVGDQRTALGLAQGHDNLLFGESTATHRV